MSRHWAILLVLNVLALCLDGIVMIYCNHHSRTGFWAALAIYLVLLVPLYRTARATDDA